MIQEVIESSRGFFQSGGRTKREKERETARIAIWRAAYNAPRERAWRDSVAHGQWKSEREWGRKGRDGTRNNVYSAGMRKINYIGLMRIRVGAGVCRTRPRNDALARDVQAESANIYAQCRRVQSIEECWIINVFPIDRLVSCIYEKKEEW